jgi:hypothetical protein
MPKARYAVFIVVDRAFGERLTNLPPGVPVWVVDSPANTPVAHRIWKERSARDRQIGITCFSGIAGGSPGALLLNELATIDLHHGRHSAKPPYTKVEIFGVSLTDAIKDALVEYGFDSFQSGLDGFSAARSSLPVGS